jgi:hypothetical protein
LGYDHRDFYRHVSVAAATATLGASSMIFVAQQSIGSALVIALLLSVVLSAAVVWHLARTRVSVSSDGLEIRPFGFLGGARLLGKDELLAGLVLPDRPTLRLELIFRHEQSVVLGPFAPVGRGGIERQIDALCEALSGHGLKMSDLRRSQFD